MAGSPHLIWVPFLLFCVFQASDNRHVHHDPQTLIGRTGNSEVDRIISHIPITLPDGIDPKNINITSIVVKSCTDMKEQLSLLDRQLKLSTTRNSQLDNEAFGLRREVRLLKLQLAACSSTASAITGSYQTQLHNKMKQLLETFDSDTFLILKTIALTREVSSLQNKVKHAANSTETTTEMEELQRQLQEKTIDLNNKKQQIQQSHPNSSLILEIISLQTEIWDLEQAKSRRGGTSLQADKRIQELQEQLDRINSQLRGNRDTGSAMLELISVDSKITMIQRLITVHIKESSTNAADYQRQWRQKTELLKKKILQLNRDENNTELTKEILKLQSEVDTLRQLMLNARRTTDTRIRELKVILEEERRKQEILQKQLEDAEYTQAQMILKIISIMKEVRELQADEQDQTTSPSQATTLQILLQTKGKEYANAQDEITELRRKLRLKTEECSGLEETYKQVKTEFEQKIEELNRAGDSKAALVLSVINLHDELKTLREEISNTKEQDRITQLQRKLEEKQDELNSKTADIERLIANPRIVLTIIELQDEIWDLQKKAANGTNSDNIRELQSRLDGLLTEIDDKGSENTKLLLKIITLQSQVEQLQRHLSDLQTSQTSEVTRLSDDLTTKKKELQKYVNELNEKNQTNARLILTVTDLHNQLRNLEIERHNDNTTSSVTISQLRKQLKSKIEEHSRDQDEIKTLQTQLQTNRGEYASTQAEVREGKISRFFLRLLLKQSEKELQKKLQLKTEECSGLEERYEQVKTEFDQKIEELNRAGDSKAALVLSVINLHDELKTLREEISNTKEQDRIMQLQRKLEEKQDELNSKTADIERLIANPRIVLTIIELQDEIWDLQKKAANGTNSDNIRELQSRLDGLLTEIDDKGSENTKLLLKIITLQSQVEQLQRHLSDLQTSQTSEVTRLSDDLTTKKKELQKYVNELNEKNQTNARLILTVTDLHNQLRNLEIERHNDNTASSVTISQLKRQLKSKIEEHSRDQDEIKTLQTQLQTNRGEYASTQAEVRELQKKLRLKTEECSGLEETYKQVKTEFEQKIEELNRAGDSKAALVLSVINLHDELKTLREEISNTKDQDRITQLQRKQEEKQDELNSKTADIERLIANPRIVLTIIELQDEIWDLQKKAANGTNSDNIRELQSRLDGLLTEIDDKGSENTKLLLKIITLQSQVEQLQRHLSDLQTSQTSEVTRLSDDLTTKKKELQKYVNELNEKNQTNARLILTVTDLHNQLRNLEIERHNDNTTSSVTISQLRNQLKSKIEEHSRDQDEIKTLQTQLQTNKREHASTQAEVRELQKKLRLKSEECSGLEERYNEVKTEFEQKIEELKRNGDSKAALVLNVINLHDELKTLREEISNTDDPDRISELQRQLKEKQNELNSKTADIERLIANPKTVLKIIELQDEIWDLQKKAANGTDSDRVKELQNRVNGLLTEIDDNDNTKLLLKIITLQSQVEQLQRQLSDLQTSRATEVTRLRNDLAAKKNEQQNYINDLNEKNQTNARLILSVTDLHNQLRNLEKEKYDEGQKTSAAITKLREQLKEKEEEHTRDQATIEALQNQLNETEAQCSSHEQKLRELQNDLDAKMKELQAKSDSVTSLALQVSTLSVQVEELKRQLKNTESETKIKELQKLLDEKTNELAKKTEELKARSTQPQRLLQIIAIQTEIEKMANVAANDTDYAKIRALQDHLNYLIDGIQDENDENTQLTFKILAQQDEIARLKKQEERQTQAELQKIKDLENELEDIRNQIKQKTQLLGSSDMRIANLSAQIMELHKQIKPLENEISFLKETNAENVKELQQRLDLSKRQLQDSELRLKDADAKNFDSIMEIADLRGKLKKAQHLASKAAKQNLGELEEQLQAQQQENKKLENANKRLEEEVKELRTCCSDASTQCDDIQSQLQQSMEDADRLQQQLHDKDLSLKQLQNEYNNLQKHLQQTQDNIDYYQQKLDEKDDKFNQLQQQLDLQIRENDKLQETYNTLQNKLSDVEDKTIHTRRITLDPNTANPRIVLSAGNTEMSTTAEIQDVPDNPGRFDVALAVLGKIGYSGGRNYWEVSVADKQCFHLGMASESARRKGTIIFNPSRGYWTIVLDRQGNYKAIDGRGVNIVVQTQPLTLGILLDYKKGEISFYDAGARSHMYSFRGQSFTDKIYPFINFCVEDVGNQTPIVLLTPGSVEWIK